MYEKAAFCSMKINSVACGFNPIKIDYSDYPKKLSTQQIKEDYVFSIKYHDYISLPTTFIAECSNVLFRCNQTC